MTDPIEEVDDLYPDTCDFCRLDLMLDAFDCHTVYEEIQYGPDVLVGHKDCVAKFAKEKGL